MATKRPPLRVAFDIDQTLICTSGVFPVERSAPNRVISWWFREELRRGTIRLMRDLRALGCELWFYTTSARSPAYLRLWFWSLGIPIAGVVNRDRHACESRLRPYHFPACTKYPPAFGIDVLIDDSAAIVEEGRAFGFDVVHVEPADEDWQMRVLEAVRQRLLHRR